MQTWRHMRLELWAALLVAAVAAQLLCPAGLLVVAASPDSGHGGCHVPAPEHKPASPQQQCCAAGASPQASPAIRYVPPAPAQGERVAGTEFVSSRTPMLAWTASHTENSPPGFTLLRI